MLSTIYFFSFLLNIDWEIDCQKVPCQIAWREINFLTHNACGILNTWKIGNSSQRLIRWLTTALCGPILVGESFNTHKECFIWVQRNWYRCHESSNLMIHQICGLLYPRLGFQSDYKVWWRVWHTSILPKMSDFKKVRQLTLLESEFLIKLAYQKFDNYVLIMNSMFAKIVAFVFVAYFVTFYSKCTYFFAKKSTRLDNFGKFSLSHTNTFCMAQEINLSEVRLVASQAAIFAQHLVVWSKGMKLK